MSEDFVKSLDKKSGTGTIDTNPHYFISGINRGIRTLNFSRKTTNVALSDLKIVDVICNQIVFQKIVNSQFKGPPLLLQFLTF